MFDRWSSSSVGRPRSGRASPSPWSVSDEGLGYTFKLRKGVKFHTSKTFKPTRDFNAQDVIFTFERQWKSDNPYHTVSGGAYEYFNSMDMPTLLNASRRWTTIPSDHPERAGSAVPRHPRDRLHFGPVDRARRPDGEGRHADQVDQEPIGTGPFQFVGYQKDAVIRYRANDAYWGGKAAIDALVFSITPDASVR